MYGNLGFKAGFSKADEVLSTASKGIAEVITHHYTQNIDLKDAKTVLSNSGTAIMGAAASSGTNRANDAITKALDSPLLNDNRITGAKNVLLLIVSGNDGFAVSEEYITSLPKLSQLENFIASLVLPKRFDINLMFSGKSRIDPLLLLPLASSIPQNGFVPYESASKV